MNKKIKNFIFIFNSFFLIIILVFGSLVGFSNKILIAEEIEIIASAPDSSLIERLSADGYSAFLSFYSGAPRPEREIIINTDGANEGKWEFLVEEAGLYQLEITYEAAQGRVGDIETRLLINGESQHRNGEMFVLPRLWTNEEQQSERFTIDLLGNEVRPRPIEVFREQTLFVSDPLFRFSGALYFYLKEGLNTLELIPQFERAYFYMLRFAQSPAPVSYQEYMQTPRSNSSGISLRTEAELADYRNSVNLFPTYDRGRVSVSPSHYRLRRYNTIGQNTWHRPGQSVTYIINVPESGFYNLAFSARQTEKRGMFSTRAVYINGELPYAELGNIRFPHRPSWFIHVPEHENGEPLKVYLPAGRNEITIAAVLGDEEELLREAEALVAELNFWYRRIIGITGSSADATRITLDLNRDFRLDQRIPGMIDAFRDIANRLDYIIAWANELYGRGGSAATMMAELATQLRAFIQDPDRIPARLQHYIDSVSSIATWAIDMRSQPLELDWFYLYSPDMPVPKQGGNFFAQLWFRLMMFFASFSSTFHNVGSIEGSIETIEVWVSLSDISAGTVAAGRDQANLMRHLIDRYFTPDTGIGVQLALIEGSHVLMQAIVAGRGPDAAVFVSRDIPINLAMRNALMHLDDFPGFDEVTERFKPGALIPYQFQAATSSVTRTYALPETQSFDVLFYRTDIFEELGLTPPNTWQEFYFVLSVLQQNNMLAGIPENQRTFESLLFQNGISVFTDDLRNTTFDQPEALAAFRQWTGLYAKYSLPLVFDFFNRFRSGEMPMAVMPYTQANYLFGAAPDINGLWNFTPIPGTLQEDGSINRATTAMGSGAIMVRQPNNPNYDAVWEFLSWWTSADAQAQFALDQENMMGAAARYPTANIEAFRRLPWLPSQMEVLMYQWEFVQEVPQVPGGYYISRNLSFAFRNVVYNFANERETLRRHNRDINNEIRRRRIEFGLPVD